MKTVDVKVIDPGVRIDVVPMEWDVDDGRECRFKQIRIGQGVRITEEVAELEELNVDEIYTVVDVIENVSYPIALSNPIYGENWVEFFKLSDIIKVDDDGASKKEGQ